MPTSVQGRTIDVHEVEQAVCDHLGFDGEFKCKDRAANLIAKMPAIKRAQHHGSSAYVFPEEM